MAQQIPQDIAEDSLVPIIVGITGHIKVDGVLITEDKVSDEQKNEIRKVFKELDLEYPNTPIVILSPLADGADRLVAGLALDTKRRNRTSISLISPLPMPQEEYERDFEKTGTKEKFRRMLELASASFVLPIIGGDITDWEKEPRKKQYEQVGKYVAQHSHILIALWNGKDKDGFDGIGGTSQIVKMRHEGNLVQRRQLDEIDNVPIYHFLTTKIGEDKIDIQPRREIFPGMTLNPPAGIEEKDEKILEQGQETIQRVFERMEMFNSDIKSMSAKHKKKIETNKGYVIPCEECADLTEMSSRVLHHYAIADTLAIRFQWWSDNTLLWLFIIVLLALTCFEIYAHLHISDQILIGYPLWMTFGLFIYLYTIRYKEVQSKYLDYRALAEGLRVQFFWILSAQTEEVVEFYLRKQKSELDWIKYAIRSFNMPFSAGEFIEKENMKTTPPERISRRMKSVVLPNWIEDQAKYFTNKTSKLGWKLKRQHWSGRSFFFLGVGTSIILFAFELSIEHGHPLEARHYLIVGIGMALAITAAIGGYTEKMAISAQAKRYAWMREIFNRAKTELGKSLDSNEIVEAQKLISELGKEALEENADWLILRRERKIEVPTG